MMKTKKRIFIIEDNLLIRTAVKRTFLDTDDFEIVGEAEDATGVLSQISELNPQFVLLDLRLKESNGYDVLLELKRKSSDTKVIVYTMKDDMATFLSCVKAGADGYLLKSDGPNSLIESLRLASDGHFVTSKQFGSTSKRVDDGNLNFLEKRVIRELKEGVPLLKIVESLSLSKEQLESVLISLKVQFGASSYPELLKMVREKSYSES
ncbi:MAG: response regulator transcription factor [Leptospira sp.]|nr:response regulator transcription factor [Leptospira sp.]